MTSGIQKRRSTIPKRAEQVHVPQVNILGAKAMMFVPKAGVETLFGLFKDPLSEPHDPHSPFPTYVNASSPPIYIRFTF